MSKTHLAAVRFYSPPTQRFRPFPLPFSRLHNANHEPEVQNRPFLLPHTGISLRSDSPPTRQQHPPTGFLTRFAPFSLPPMTLPMEVAPIWLPAKTPAASDDAPRKARNSIRFRSLPRAVVADACAEAPRANPLLPSSHPLSFFLAINVVRCAKPKKCRGTSSDACG